MVWLKQVEKIFPNSINSDIEIRLVNTNTFIVQWHSNDKYRIIKCENHCLIANYVPIEKDESHSWLSLQSIFRILLVGNWISKINIRIVSSFCSHNTVKFLQGYAIHIDHITENKEIAHKKNNAIINEKTIIRTSLPRLMRVCYPLRGSNASASQ